MKQLELQYDPPVTVNVDGIQDLGHEVWYIGNATRQLDGKWTCLADVGGFLCRVQVKITSQGLVL